MSEYLYRDMEPNAQQIVRAAIRMYPKLWVELAREEADIINETPHTDVRISSGPGDPTAQKAMRLSSKYRLESERKCEAVKKCLDDLIPQHRRVVCLRFWGTSTAEEAIKKAKRKHPLRGLDFSSALSLETVSHKSGYAEKQPAKICKAFVRAVGQELGEI